ncbi:MAG: hypothetical protein U0892_15460 [Pirellulales bacterium]
MRTAVVTTTDVIKTQITKKVVRIGCFLIESAGVNEECTVGLDSDWGFSALTDSDEEDVDESMNVTR